MRGGDGTVGIDVFDGVVCAVGQLNRPSFPAIAGRETFGGPSFHSAAWDDSVELAGRRVAVIGTGASAAQFVPCLVGEVGHLDVYQRTPPWLLPTENYGDPFPPEFHDLLALLPSYGRWDRLWQFWLMHEGLLAAARVDPAWDGRTESVSAGNDFVRSMLLDVLRAQVESDELYEKMVPHFPPFAKRALRDDGRWAAALGRPDVDLVTTAIAEITPRGVRTADGVEHPADVLIYGTGFSASDFVAPMRVFGSGGVELNEEWGGDARAYLGITVPGFPNFFMLYGPNTNLVINGSILVMVECQVRYVVEAIGRLLRSGHRTMSCRRDVHERYGRQMEEGNATDGVGCGGRADVVPQRPRAGHPELAVRPPLVLVPHARARPGRLRAGLNTVPSRELTEILALVPADFADPEADYRAVRAMMAPFHGHPVPPHVTVTEVELGGVRSAWYDDTRRPRLRAGRLPLPRRRPGVVPTRRLPLLRRHAGRAARGAGRAWRTTAWRPSTSFRRRTRTAWPPTAGSCPAGWTRRAWWSAATPVAACWHWARCSRRATKDCRCRRASCRSRAGSTSPWPRRWPGWRATRSSPPGGSATGGGSTPEGGWRSTTRGCRPSTPTSGACPRSTSRWASSTRCARVSPRWPWRRCGPASR